MRASLRLLTLAIAFAAATAQALPVSAGPAHCPPGHAKKGWCAPGSVVWRIGGPVASGYVVITEPSRRGLPPPRRGQVYVEIDEDVLLLAVATGMIVDVFTDR